MKYVELLDTCFLVLKKKPLSQCNTSAAHLKQILMISSIPSYISPRRHCVSLLHTAHRRDGSLVGTHHTQPRGSCRHVLLLLSDCERRSSLVEKVHHTLTDLTICHRPGLHILCLLRPLCRKVQAWLAESGVLSCEICTGSFHWCYYSVKLSCAVSCVLCCHIQERPYSTTHKTCGSLRLCQARYRLWSAAVSVNAILSLSALLRSAFWRYYTWTHSDYQTSHTCWVGSSREFWMPGWPIQENLCCGLRF